MSSAPDLPAAEASDRSERVLPTDLTEADRLTPYAAAVRYGLGDPGAVPTSDALRWAALAIEWADTQLRSNA